MANRGRTSSHDPNSLVAGVVDKETALRDLTERLQRERDEALAHQQTAHDRAIAYLQAGHERYVRSLRAELGEKIARLAQAKQEVEAAIEDTRGHLFLALKINAEVGDDNARLQKLLLEASEVSQRLEAALRKSNVDKGTIIADLRAELACQEEGAQSLQAEVARLTTQISAQASEIRTLRQHNQTLDRRLRRARGEPDEPQPAPLPAPTRSRWNPLRR